MGSWANRRRLWVFLFMILGLPALFSAVALPFNPLLALPWVVLTWTVAVVSGYRIWRIDHPYDSAGHKIARWLYLLLSSAAALIALVLIRAEPLLLVVALAGWLLLIALVGVGLWLAHRGTTNL